MKNDRGLIRLGIVESTCCFVIVWHGRCPVIGFGLFSNDAYTGDIVRKIHSQKLFLHQNHHVIVAQIRGSLIDIGDSL